MRMNIWSQVQKQLLKIIIIATLLFGLLCLFGAFFMANGGNSSITLYNPFLLFLGTLVYTGTLLAIRKVISKLNSRSLKLVSLGLSLVFLMGLLLFGVGTRSILSVDLKAVHIEAVNMLNSGRIAESNYFLEYPYQQKITILIYYILRLGELIGVHDYRLMENLAIIFADLLTFFFTYLTVNSFRGQRAAVMVEAMMVLNPIFYLYTSFLYSDIFCLPFMMAGFWMVGKSQQEMHGIKKRLFLALAGILLGLGAQVRSTVLFALIALLVVLVLKKNWKSTMQIGAILSLFFVIGSLLFQPALQMHGTPHRNSDDEMPATLFVMMGLSKESRGSYYYPDYLFNKQFETKEERNAQNLSVIKDRLSDMGVTGFLDLLITKVTKEWSDGRIGYAASTWNGSRENYGPLYEYTMGDKSILVWYIMQIMRCVLYILFCICLISAIRGVEGSELGLSMMILCLGAFIFYAFWEAQPRYSLMWLPVMMILSGIGLDRLAEKCFRCSGICIHWEDSEPTKIMKTKLLHFVKQGWSFVMVLTLLTLILLYPQYAGQMQNRLETRVRQAVWTRVYDITTMGLEQTITPNGELNRISILFSNRDATPAAIYHFILSREDGAIITEQSFVSDNIQDNTYYNFNFDRVYVEKDERLIIKLVAEDDVTAPIGVCVAYEKWHPSHTIPFDFYPGGELLQEDAVPYEDMTLLVTNLKERPIFSERVYLALSAGVLLLEMGVLFCIIGDNKKEKCVDG